VRTTDFSIFARDQNLPLAADLTVERIRDELRHAIPADLFDTDPDHYEITNLRYKPGEKLILSLASAEGKKPIALRMFRPGIAYGRFRKAQSYHPSNSFLLEDLHAVAWVFPAERKLDLGIVANHDRLSEIIEQHRGITLEKFELVHFVPEHTYTARIEGTKIDSGSVTEFLKIYYDGSGMRTVSVMADLASQVTDDRAAITLPTNASYVPAEKMLLQSALPRVPDAELDDATAARALAAFHDLKTRRAHWEKDIDGQAFRQAEDMVGLLFPRHRHELAKIRAEISARSARVESPGRVLIHGDAHLGNMLPLPGGRVGMIDLDGTCWGSPNQDLATYFGFRLWLRVRANESTDDLLDEFPAFIDEYNRFAAHPVGLTGAYLRLATKMVTQRVRRAISRGKLTDGAELDSFINLANRCVELSEYDYA